MVAWAEIDEGTPAVQRPGQLDPRSPLVLDTHELGRAPGSMRPEHRTVAAPAELGTVVIGIPEGSDLELDLRLEAVTEGVLVSGTVRGQAVGECVRCLDRVLEDVEVTLSELAIETFLPADPQTAEALRRLCPVAAGGAAPGSRTT